VNYYPQLARALLDAGDTEQSIIAFLRSEYGLDRTQAKAAIVLARHIDAEPDTTHRREPRMSPGARR
jgi:hypothetical protein